MGNICRFIPSHPSIDTIHIINFVQEMQNEPLENPTIGATYKVFYIIDGSGILSIEGKKTKLCAGDIFFLFPGMQFSVTERENFVCMYISFLGMRANMIMDRLNITPQNNYFSSFPEIRPFWQAALCEGKAAPDLVSESVLLYTFSQLADRKRTLDGTGVLSAAAELILRIKEYADKNFADPTLSLSSVAARFSYNKKYLSTAFKKQMKTNFSTYLNIVRCRHACRLMEQQFTCMQDIAYLCGFNDSMYFSRVFKKQMGISPSGYRNNLKKTESAQQ